MLSRGLIVETSGNIAKVRIDEAQSCAHCNAGCMKRMIVHNIKVAEAHNSVGAQKGDTVLIEFNSQKALMASLITFGVPIIFLLIGVAVSSFILKRTIYANQSQILSMIAGLFAFLISFIPAKIYDGYLSRNNECSITILEKVNPPFQNLPE